MRSTPSLLLLAVLAGCVDPGPALRVSRVGSRVGFVGTELAIPLSVEGARGPVRFEVRADVPDLCRGGRCRAGVDTSGDAPTLRWRPRPEDAGLWRFELAATDGHAVAGVRFPVEIRSAVGYEGRPRFLRPLGGGATVPPGDCFEVELQAHDPDSRQVALSIEPPSPPGATVTSTGPYSAVLSWCPDASHAALGWRELTVRADDGEHPPTRKRLTLVVLSSAKPGCEGQPPIVEHEPIDLETALAARVRARVRDDSGRKLSVRLYWSATDPGAAPDLGAMAQESMVRVEGDHLDGVWEATLDNPAHAAGGPAALHYVIVARDDDDPDGGCDHEVAAPAVGAFTARVTAPTGAPGEPACAPCSVDAACGGPGDLCVAMAEGDRCMSACGACPAGFTCADAVGSVDGARAAQCVPVAGACAPAPTDGCPDDTVDGATPLAPGAHAMTICDDDDWFGLSLDVASRVVVRLSGHDGDLDLELVDDAGGIVSRSEGPRADEEVTGCLPPGEHRVRVRAFSATPLDYELSWSARPASCASTTCVDDADEPDDGPDRAHPVDLDRGLELAGRAICAGDEDWYAVDLDAGETLRVELRFVQTSTADDLDLHFLDASLEDLTPCSEADPSTCSAFQGQSVDSDEIYEHTAERAGRYYLVVRGFAGAQNDYDVRLSRGAS